VKRLLEPETLAPYRLPGMGLSRDPGPDFYLAPLSVVPGLIPHRHSGMRLSGENCFPSGKLVKLNIVLEPFRMRFEMPEQRL